MNNVLIGVAYPWRRIDCEALREALPHHPIPLVRAGSTIERCTRCHIPVAVGPRLRATGLKVICALCAHTLGMEGF